MEKLLANEVVQSILQPETLADALSGFALLDPDLVELNAHLALLRVSRIRRTEVRPMFSLLAISALLTPARYSLRISADLMAAVAGLSVLPCVSEPSADTL